MLELAWDQTIPLEVATCSALLMGIPTVRTAELAGVNRRSVLVPWHAAHTLPLSSWTTFLGVAHAAWAVTVAAFRPVGTSLQT
ncbi:MAG: hypothetical protein WCK73_13725 [Deltaproteobacteria bacterium]